MFFLTAYMGGEHGAAKSACDFLHALVACHQDVYVISPLTHNSPTEGIGFPYSNPRWLGPTATPPLPPLRELCSPKVLWREFLLRLNWRIAKHQARNAVVIVNGWASYDFWRGFSPIFYGKRVIVVRESPRHFAGGDRTTTLSHLLTGFAEFDVIIYVSENSRNDWLRFPQLKNKTSFTLPNCCEEEAVERTLELDRSSLRVQFGFHKDDFVVLCPGTLEHRKGQDLLLSIAPQLALQIRRLRIVFVGNIGTKWGEQLVSRIFANAEYGCSHMESRPHVLDLMYASDVLAFPSRAEAMPRTILEAMAIGLPVVAAAVDGVPELIENGVSGILFESESAQDLAEGILTIERDTNKARSLAEAARGHYWIRFSRRKQIDRLRTILKNI